MVLFFSIKFMTKNRNPLYVQQPRENGRFIPRDKPTAQPVCVALTYDIDEVVRQIPNRSEWLRRVITEAAQRELMNASPGEPITADDSVAGGVASGLGDAKHGLDVSVTDYGESPKHGLDDSPPGTGSEKPKRGRKPKGTTNG
jgi:hypothetical protein